MCWEQKQKFLATQWHFFSENIFFILGAYKTRDPLYRTTCYNSYSVTPYYNYSITPYYNNYLWRRITTITYNAVPQQFLCNAVLQQLLYNAVLQQLLCNAVLQQLLCNAVLQQWLFITPTTEADTPRVPWLVTSP